MTAEFVDTNIFIYAYDRQAGKKQEIAQQLLSRLADERNGVISIQVLMEFWINATKKIAHPISEKAATELINLYGVWPTFSPKLADLLLAIRHCREQQLNFWDALIVQASCSMKAAKLWSEDFQHGQKIAGVEILNPFV